MNRIANLIRTNIYLNTLWHLALIIVAFTLCRIIFYFFNNNYFHNINFISFIKILFAGLRYDLSAICLLNIPFVFFRTLPFNIRFNKHYEKTIIKQVELENDEIKNKTNFQRWLYFLFKKK